MKKLENVNYMVDKVPTAQIKKAEFARKSLEPYPIGVEYIGLSITNHGSSLVFRVRNGTPNPEELLPDNKNGVSIGYRLSP